MSKTSANTTAPSLKLLAEDKDHKTGVSKVTTFRVDPDNVLFEKGFNVRTQDDTWEAHVDRLYLAMKAGAAVPPIDLRVDAGKMYVVEGHARTLAARRLKKEVPDFTLEARNFRGNEQERVLHMLGTGSGQKPLTPLEQGLGYFRLVKYGMTSQQIADKLGVSRVTVDNGLTLAEAPVEVQELVKSGAVSSTTAREAVKQGAEGVEALVAAAAAPAPAATKSGKASKKKKVTAKKLKGTAADKKTKTKKASKKAAAAAAAAVPSEAPSEPTPAPTVADGEMLVKLSKDHARAAVDFLHANAPETDEALKAFASAIELALM